VALALCELGARSITLLVRSPVRAAETLSAIDRHASRPAVTVGSLDHDPVSGDVVVSTVPPEAQSPDLVDRCAAVPVLFDVVYEPWPTPLAASAGGRVLVSGFDLLLHQAALQFEMFTGLAAPLEVMRAALPAR
jgi:shikimate dehydrogenase